MIPIWWTVGFTAQLLGLEMRLVGSREAQAVTGLSADQLREWTGRRGLVAPDIPASGKGTQARFSWQTLLVLRIACALKDHLHIELAAHRSLFANLQDRLSGHPFHALSDLTVVIVGGKHARLSRYSDLGDIGDEPVVVVKLSPHLAAVMSGFGVSAPMAQLPLFPAVGLR
jgi:hypothetical protein